MTTGNYRPPVLMIRMKDHEKSEEYAEISRKSWEKEGFTVTYFDAITPETMTDIEPIIDFREKLLLRPKELERQAMAKSKGYEFKGIFSETEKAVWYSHVKVWEHVIETKEPTIICEHDALLNHVNWDCENYDFYTLSRNILGAGFYHPNLLRKFQLRLFNENDKIIVRMNPDAYMYDFIHKYTRGKRGRKIRSKTHFIRNYKRIPRKKWPVIADKWTESTIEHRKFYDGRTKREIHWESGK